MKVSKQKNGFTMVELLAVIVILGIIMAIAIPAVNHLIGRSKKENIESHKRTLVMAAESYLQHNKNELPSDIGDSRNITAKTLKETNYLKEDIYNADKKSCMEDSFVKVTKKGTKKYNYTAHIYCAGDKVPDKLKIINPTAKILFTDADGVPYNINKQNVTSAVVNIDINAAESSKDPKKEITLEGYSYIISASYDSTDKLVEIYNSGSLNANGKRNIKITGRDVTEYIDITRLSYLVVTVEAYNSVGGHLKTSANSNYQDSTKPICGATEGEPGEDEWNRNWRTKRITIKCSDGEGSGCVRDTFTKTFTKEAEKGIITIRDNAGNKTDCEVRVHLDWTKPTLTIKAYKRLANGSKGTLVGSAEAKEGSDTVDLNKYTDTYPTSNAVVSSGDGNWMNKAKYPNGVYFEVETNDNVKLGRGVWSENAKNLTKTSSGITSITEKYVKEFTNGDKKTSFSLADEGYRYGTYVLRDKALNEVTIRVTAPIDRTLPTVPTVSLYKRTTSTAATSSSGLSAYPNNTWFKGWVFTQASKSTDAISGFDHYEVTTTGKTTNESNAKKTYRNIDAQGTSTIKYRAMDKAGNYSAYSGVYTIKLDRKAPTCSNIARLSNKSGNNYTSGKWVNQSVYTAAKCSESGDVSKCSGVRKVTTTGKTTNVTKKENDSRTINAQGVSKSTWYVYDNAGNEGKCDTITEKIDKTKPSCSTSKSNTYTTGGVTVSIKCTDQSDLSGVNSCPSKKTGIKSSKTYKTTDKAGNSNTCSVTVYSKRQHRNRTRTDATCTSAKCCGENVSTYSKSSNHSTGCATGCSGCSYPSCQPPSGCKTSSSSTSFEYQLYGCIKRRSCSYTCTKKTPKTCKSSCCGYTAWSGWSSWKDGSNGCGGTYCQSQYRTLYY